MITKKTANSPIKIAITGVVPQPGATFPYSEFNGFNKVPSGVVNAVSTGAFLDTFEVPVAIINKIFKLVYFLEYLKKNKIYDIYML
jgi:hypothetical protein